jgi:hypothetical protein
MSMKKFWLICLVGLMAIGMGLAGCAGSPAPAETPSEAVADEETVDEAEAEAEVADEAAEEEAAEAEAIEEEVAE